MADDETNSPPKWNGRSTAHLNGPTPDQVWPFLEDFCNIHNWFPGLDTCYRVEGVVGQPGLVRYCAATMKSSSDGVDEINIKWAKEKLIMIDQEERCIRYEIVDNNMGFKWYTATMKVMAMEDGDDGCKIEWQFECDPIDGRTYQQFASYVDSVLHSMARKMEKVILSTSPT